MTHIASLKATCEYDELEESPVDNLIAYKDALEDTVLAIEHTVDLQEAGYLTPEQAFQTIRTTLRGRA